MDTKVLEDGTVIMTCDEYCYNLLKHVDGDANKITNEQRLRIMEIYPEEYMMGFYNACTRYFEEKYKK